MTWIRILLYSCLVSVLLGLSPGAASRAQEQPARILALFPYGSQVPVIQVVEATLRRQFSESHEGPIDLYSDYLDFARFPGSDFERLTAQYLAKKYAIARPDVVLALGYSSEKFFQKYRDIIAPGIPVVIIADSMSLEDIKSIPNATGVSVRENLAGTLELARRLQPGATKVTVISGASRRDRDWALRARRELAAYANQYDIEYWEALPYDQLLAKVSRLPRNSIVLFTTMFADGNGRPLTTADVAGDIARASSAPLYGPYESFIGSGAVGAHVTGFEAWGTAVADLALKTLRRVRDKRPLPEPAVLSATTDIVDARALSRWGLSEANLPDGTKIRFAEPSLWREHRVSILTASAVLVAQSLLIGALIYQSRRRQAAEIEARRRMGQLAVMNRRATAGELSASIAHEIKQPLSAIVTNSSVGLRWLAKDVPNAERAAAALNRISADAHRANKVIESIRAMFKTETQRQQPVDINEVVREVVALVSIDLREHQIAVRTSLSQGMPRVVADRIQLQQVILNLVRNATEAMGAVTDRPKLLRIESAANGQGEVIVSIEDSGPGIPPDILERLFEPFITSKSDGMGVGLSICRSIVEGHGGRLSASKAKVYGAIFEIALPCA